MIISELKPLEELEKALAEFDSLFLVGCGACATVCKAGGEEEIYQLQEWLAKLGKEVTGSMVIDEACHIMRSARDLRHHKNPVQEADALVVLACGSGVHPDTHSPHTTAITDTTRIMPWMLLSVP